MSKLNKVVTVLSKICEVALWIGAAGMLLLFLASLLIPAAVGGVLATGNLTISGMGISAEQMTGENLLRAVTMVGLAGMLIMPLSAMVCRNINLIFRTAAGETSFSKGATPFQKDNVRMVREIGIFCILIPIVELVVSMIAGAYAGGTFTELTVDANGIFFGLVILCLSRFFAYGMSLQEEVDGLL